MRDGVADVLAQRVTLDRGAGLGIALSLLLHGGLIALAVYAATHASAPTAAPIVSIEFANMPGPAAAPVIQQKPATPKPADTPKIEEPKPKPEPKITEPKPVATTAPAKVEKNTVPLSPFGRSTKKGSETPPVAKPAPAPSAAPAAGTTRAEEPISGLGVTELEGGDFSPYTLYIRGMQRRFGTNWIRPEASQGTAVVIYFRIERDGTISESRVETSSGNSTFDRAALSAVRSSSPLNPLPYAFKGTYLGVRQPFR